MLETANRAFVAALVALALCGVFISILTIATDLLGTGTTGFEYMQRSSDISIASAPPYVAAQDSPYVLDITVLTPPLEDGDVVLLEAYSGDTKEAEADCLAGPDYGAGGYAGLTNFSCELGLPYGYNSSQDFGIYAVMHRGDASIYSGPYRTHVEWSGYEHNLQGALVLMFAVVACAYLLLVLPVGFGLLYQGMKSRHRGAKSAYTLETLFNPLGGGRTLLQKFESFLTSPYFWGIEAAGVLVIFAYLFFSAGAWKSLESLSSFALSGLIAFIIPFLWCAAFWYADFRDREPLRMIITFFLWGCLAALMAIGINTVWGAAFELIGLGFIGIVLVAPLTEEFFKGSGLALLSEHQGFDSVEDGLLFGFTIGMGFAFVENWLYLIDNPFSADIWGWLFLFLLRAVLFSANHGVYTAITGGVIGLLKERKFAAPALGLVPGVIAAFVFHAAHNSGSFLADVLGVGGLVAYCCILVPFFDYGGLLLLLAVFAWAVLRKKK